MKIVLLINHFQPKIGYQEYFLAKYWQELGHKVTVVCSEYYFPFPNYDKTVKSILGDRKQKVGKKKERGIDTVRLKSTFQLPGGFVAWLNDLEETIKKTNPDIVFADGVFQPLAIQIALIKRRSNFKLIYDSHASSFNTKLHGSLIKDVYMKLFKIIAIPFIKSQADAFTAVGESEKNNVLNEYKLKKNQVHLIHLGADTQIFYPNAQSKKDFRKKIKVKQNETLFIYAGKVTRNKDLDILFKAFAKLNPIENKFKLLIIGTGPSDFVETLKDIAKREKVENQVIYLPQQKHKILAAYYNAADIGIWPGDLSNTIQECMACGTPVVIPQKVSKQQNTKHLSKCDSVKTFKRKSTPSLCKAIASLYKDKNSLKRKSKAAAKFIESEFSWKEIAKKHLNLASQINEKP